MQRRNAAIAAVTLSISAFVVGRGWWKPAEKEVVVEETFDVLRPATKAPVPPANTAPASQRRELKLRVGDEFPFLRTVEQTVTQSSAADPVTSRSSLELVMALRVEEVRDLQKRLRVRYRQVRYAQDIAGERMSFDSRSPRTPVPVSARAYHGLVNNGFDIWLDADNRPLALEEFEAFLKRCVRDVPGEHRQTFSAALVGMSQDDSIANFVDESVGLLTYVTAAQGDVSALRVGAQWEQQRQIARPFPLLLTNLCTLRAVDEHSATIDIVGQIHPAPEWTGATPPSNEVAVRVRGGRAIGYCIIDRNSGLPIESRMERNLDLAVRSKDGASIDQQKHVLTTMRALPNESSPSATPVHPPTAATTNPQPTSPAATNPAPTSENGVVNTSFETPKQTNTKAP